MSLTVDECKRIISKGRRQLTEAEERIEQLEQLVRDMMELDQMRHGPFSWEREEKKQDMRGSINARLIRMGFVTEVKR